MATQSRRDVSGEMKNMVQNKYLQRMRKRKRDRLRKLMKSKEKKKLNKSEEKEMKQLQAELSSSFVILNLLLQISQI